MQGTLRGSFEIPSKGMVAELMLDVPTDIAVGDWIVTAGGKWRVIGTERSDKGRGPWTPRLIGVHLAEVSKAELILNHGQPFEVQHDTGRSTQP